MDDDAAPRPGRGGQDRPGEDGHGREEGGPGRLVLVRHGRTEWARSGRHTGLSDVALDEVGREQARATRPLLQGLLAGEPALVLTSPLVRAAETARLVGLEAAVEPDLVEWDYGAYEGMTSREVSDERGAAWEIFADGVAPGGEEHPGELLEQVAARCARVLARVRGALGRGDVVLVGHGHCTRIMAAVWLGLSPRAGAALELDPAAVCVLSHRHGVATVERWNLSPGVVRG